MECKCGKPFARHSGEFTTLVGSFSPLGHNHDDNCRSRVYVCEDGHTTTLSKRNRCHACEWVGKAECFCHPGLKIDEWPETQYQMSIREAMSIRN